MPVVLVTGGYDHKIRFWDATSGVCNKSISFGESQVNCIQVSSDKSLLAAGGNPMIQLFDVNMVDERPLLTYDGHSNNVTTVGFQRDQKWIYSSSEDGTVRVWDTRSNNYSRKYDCGSPVNTVCIHPNQAELISGDQNGTIKVWDLTADKCREEYTPLPEIPIRSISIVSNFVVDLLKNCDIHSLRGFSSTGVRRVFHRCGVSQGQGLHIHSRR